MDDLKFPPTGGVVPPNLPIAKDINPGGNLPPPAKISTGLQLPSSPPPTTSFRSPASIPSITPRSSIRTMESDMKSAQTGQPSKGIEVKPPVFSVEPSKPISPTTPPKTPVLAPIPPAGIKLGEAEKRTSPLPGQIKLPSPVSPTAPLLPVQMVRPPAPVLPKQPPVPPVKAPPIQGGIAIPSKLSIFANKRVMAIVALVVLVLAGGLLYLRFGNPPADGPDDISVVTPTPNVTPVSTLAGGLPTSSTLSTVFKQPAPLSITVGSGDSQSDELTDFRTKALNLSNENPEKNLLVSVKFSFDVNYKFSNFLDRFQINFPINLLSSVEGSDFGLILTKQTEFFDQNGELITNPSAEDLLTPKIALAVRVVDATEARIQLTSWEDTMKESFADFGEFYDLFSMPTEKLPFSDNVYQGVPVRFLNSPYPDKTIDYSIITAKNGNDYLVIANSREQIYSIIDKLLGF